MTGIARYAMELTRALRGLSPDLEIVLLNPNSESTHSWYKEFPTYPLPALRRLPSVVTFGSWLLHRAAQDLQLDILHDPCGIAPFLVPRGPFKRVTTVHDAVPFVYPRTQPLLTRFVFHTLVRAASHTADAILTDSAASARDLARYASLPETKVHVTLLGVNAPPPMEPAEVRESLDRLGHGIGTRYLLYVGALHPRKNLRRVVEAFHLVRSEDPGAQLVVVGPPSWGAHDVLRGVREAERDKNGIILTGFVSDSNLHALYYGAQALVFPSLYEGFGLPPLEAMAHGTPVITSDVSSLPEVVGNTALLVDPYRTDEIADAMKRVLHDDLLRHQLRLQGRARADMMSWTATAEKTLSVYRGLLAS